MHWLQKLADGIVCPTNSRASWPSVPAAQLLQAPSTVCSDRLLSAYSVGRGQSGCVTQNTQQKPPDLDQAACTQPTAGSLEMVDLGAPRKHSPAQHGSWWSWGVLHGSSASMGACEAESNVSIVRKRFLGEAGGR